MSSQAPSLFADTEVLLPAVSAAPPSPPSGCLVDQLYEGFYMLFLLRNKHAPTDARSLRHSIRDFLTEFEHNSLQADASAEDVYLAKYAFCALVDETVLTSSFKVRDDWERQPLQLQFFGDQLAGENFFVHLEKLRQQGASRLAALEAFHMCLLLGFQGKYLLEGPEKLGYLTARLSDEIAHLKGRKSGFAPHWAPPDRVRHVLRAVTPLWVLGGGFILLALLAFAGFRATLAHNTRADLAGHQQLVQLPPQAAHLVITLP